MKPNECDCRQFINQGDCVHAHCDADLISACPEMYVALKKLVGRFEAAILDRYGNEEGQKRIAGSEVLSEAKVAIAKAERRNP